MKASIGSKFKVPSALFVVIVRLRAAWKVDA
jgi:hypothetical protein